MTSQLCSQDSSQQRHHPKGSAIGSGIPDSCLRGEQSGSDANRLWLHQLPIPRPRRFEPHCADGGFNTVIGSEPFVVGLSHALDVPHRGPMPADWEVPIAVIKYPCLLLMEATLTELVNGGQACKQLLADVKLY